LQLDKSLGLGWLEAVHPDDREATRAAWVEARRSGEYFIEHRVRCAADGEYRWHQTRAHPVEGGSEHESLDWVGAMTDIHDLRDLKDRQQVLMAELQHRTRNLLAVVQAIAARTIQKSRSLTAFRTEFEARLRALGRVQDLIAGAKHQDIDLRTLVATELSAHGDASAASRKIRIEGPPVALSSMAAQALALALHELATNAVKYGALAQASGRLSVVWRSEGTQAERRLALEWRESGVTMPCPSASGREGFGSELIRRALPYQLQADTTLEFLSDGVRCTISSPV
jgi:two-component sensor histidine kinase